jgi:hypothetical protein
MNTYQITDILPANVDESGTYCVKDKKSAGFKAKALWYKNQYINGLRIKIVIDSTGKQLGFIEFIDSENAWRPVNAKNYIFIHCIGIFSKENREANLGSALIKACEDYAAENNKDGVCVMCSDGVWIADKSIFIKNEYQQADKLDRFELMYKSLNEDSPTPLFFNWKEKQKNYQGWHLIYSDQCPWHEKAAVELKTIAEKHGIELNIQKIKNAKEAQNAPSGFATFSLLYNGKLLEDHYISKTRFENILAKEVKS